MKIHYLIKFVIMAKISFQTMAKYTFSERPKIMKKMFLSSSLELYCNLTQAD